MPESPTGHALAQREMPATLSDTRFPYISLEIVPPCNPPP
jgi:hypothetical protein